VRGLSSVLRLPRMALIVLVRGYRLLLSPWVGQSCRFAPTCSLYAIDALQKHGAIVGTGLAAWRILRCNPFCHGGCDPVPDNMPWDRARAPPSANSAAGLFTGLLQREPGADPATATPAAAATDDPTLSKTPS
jgi:putative membrane protein insertion efficiency factor